MCSKDFSISLQKEENIWNEKKEPDNNEVFSTKWNQIKQLENTSEHYNP